MVLRITSPVLVASSTVSALALVEAGGSGRAVGEGHRVDQVGADQVQAGRGVEVQVVDGDHAAAG